MAEAMKRPEPQDHLKPEALLTAQELADRWRRRLEAIYWMRNRREGPPAIVIGRELRFRLSDVEAWETEQAQRDLDKRRVGAA